MSRAAMLTLAAALTLLAAAPASGRLITSSEQLPPLRASEPGPIAGLTRPVSSRNDMAENKAYIVRVRRIYGAYLRQLMTLRGPVARGWHFCGDRIGARAQDAEFIWGLPLPVSTHCPAFPIRHRNLRLDAGAGFAWHAPVATLPQPGSLAVNNRYEYLVKRTNGSGPLSAAIADSQLGDNRGALRLRVRPLRVADCQGLGWMRFGGAFTSEPDCLSATS